MAQDFDKLKVKSGKEIKLSNIDTEAKEFKLSKEEAAPILEKNIEKLKELQEKLYAEHKQSILVVLQAIDGGGKDGTIEHVFGPLNSAGCRVASFKVPTPIEADHDFLWRVHAQTPAKGEIVVFNRSHYEQVLVVRVHDLETKEINKTRYDQINDFEKLLASNNTHILKFFLHISKDTQLQRFKDRIDDPLKHWKVAAGDFKERALWDDYMAAFEDMVNKCSKENAPWFVIPADKKWFRDLAISQILVDYMEGMNIQLPQTDEDIEAIKKLYEAECKVLS
ncbi:MAG: polyphosphate kinase 2 family protein [Caulobacterales bacterium]|nr:polyphosphate kinase 2 family protein [Caulobacterales bacterium]MCA0373035.1 polyphosphate kinase 2 family protein [Pseudomonadota bacterium]